MMGWNEDKLREAAHKLALEHQPREKRISPAALWSRVEPEIAQLRSFVRELNEHRGICAQPAEEWLLDHSEFIEAEALDIREEIAHLRLKALPATGRDGQLRISSICKSYLEQTDGVLDEETFAIYLAAYQEVAVLTIAESWHIPLFMKIELIRRLTAIMEPVKERRAVCDLVERVLSGIPTAELTPERLKLALEDAHVELPLSGAMIVHLVKHLREHAEDSAHLGEWLVCKLDNGPESLDSILSYDYQLQAEYQVSAGNAIGSLRKLARLSWSELFERINAVEQALREEQAGDYPRLDAASRHTLRSRVEKLARRMKVPEKLVASQAVRLADARFAEAGGRDGQGGEDGRNGGDSAVPPRDAYAAYYLLEGKGLKALHRALKECGKAGMLPEAGIKRRATGIYFQLLTLASALALAGLSAWGVGNGPVTPLGWALALLLLAVPASEWGVTALHWLVERAKRPTRLLRYDFSKGVPEEAATMVVIPVIWSRVEEVKSAAERLELHHLANRDPNIHFAILSDYRDADAERMPEDEALLAAAKAEIERLNRDCPLSTFHLFHRSRRWNPSENVWMGWERKRGKLVEFVRLLQGSRDTSYSTVVGDSSVLERIRYVITLDADTQLPLESAHRMIGAIHLPYNRPRLNASGTRVVEGYGVLQPRIGMTYESAQRSRLSALWASEPGLDPYAFAVSDPYQDAMGQGIFTGKGIFDVETFGRVLGNRFPENRVLSHDLLEGGYLRAGFLSDIELIDEHPSTFLSHQKRLHRWTRGDWQLLPWLARRCRDGRNELVPTDLTLLTRWQIVDNLRRSLLQPALLAILLLAAPALPGSPLRWYGVALLTLLLPLLRQLANVRGVVRRPESLLAAGGQAIVAFVTLPFQSAMLLDAIGRTLYRLSVSKRKLLEWVNQAEVERLSARKGAPPLAGLYGGSAFTFLMALGAVTSGRAAVAATGLLMAALWSAAPLLVRWLDRAPVREPKTWTPEESEELFRLARDIWSFYEDFVTPRDHWLPPDNVQIEPDRGIAHRTSPTNIGMYLTCVLAARDFGFIDTAELVERLERTVDTIERMEKWEGHLYNWYDTETLEPLPPVYVSTVDSGNLVACLLTVKEGLLEWVRAARDGSGERPRSHAPARQTERAFDVAFADELGTGSGFGSGSGPGSGSDSGSGSGLGSGSSFGSGSGFGSASGFGSGFGTGTSSDSSTGSDSRSGFGSASGSGLSRDLIARGTRLAARIDALARATDFRPLYDPKANLLSLGYHVRQGAKDAVLYDLLASEARQASFVAIALGQVSVSHWNALGRTLTKNGRRPVLLSWSGTMFEYLMPWLLMKTYRRTLWDSTYRAVVERQIEYARQRDVPFGISESGYFAFDYQMNYQYRAFGVPGLGFKRGLEQDLVLAPYATIMALPYAFREGLMALREMERLGGRGRYGYYEAIDFTPRRMPKGRRHMVVRSFMAHHQGMSLLTLANLLLPRPMYDRFHRNKEVQAAELLLQERIPRRPRWIKHPAMYRAAPDNGAAVRGTVAVREFASPHTATPEVCLLSNGRFLTMVTASGGGYAGWEGLLVSRWREEPVKDNWGSAVYIRDVLADRLWSAAYHPCRAEPLEQRIAFEQGKAVFERKDGAVATRMEICVSPEADAEVRRITLKNTGGEPKVLEVTTFVELALASPIADEAHPAFSKLFIRTAYDEGSGCLVAGRRKREAKDRELWAAHLLVAEDHALGPAEFETDRAAFVGRGHTLAEPQAIRARLQGKTGSVADPAFVMRRRIQLEPGEQVSLYAVTSAAESREDAVNIAARLAGAQAAERSFQMAWTRSQIELRNLQLAPAEAAAFQRLAGQVLYTPPLRNERRLHIAGNAKGQSGLWSFGVSGDRPIVLAHIDNRSHMPFMIKLLTGHEYLRRLGLRFDLVVLSRSDGGYQQELQDALRQAVEHGVDRFGAGPADIHVIPDDRLSADDRTLLVAAARVTLRAGGPSLAGQLRLPRRMAGPPLPGPLLRAPEAAAAGAPEAAANAKAARPAAVPRPTREPALAAKDTLFYNGWGGFSPDGASYRIAVRDGKHLPAPWSNVLANPGFGTLVTELGTGYTFWRNSRECKLTPWSNDPVLDPPGELAYLRDEESGEVWTAAPGAGKHAEPYLVTHGRGFTSFEHERGGIRHTMTVFVPLEDPVKIMRLRLQNNSSESRTLSVTYYAEWVIGVQRQANAPFIVSEWDESAALLTAQNRYQETFREATAFLGVFPQQDGASGSVSWTSDQAEFIGRNGSPERPAALKRSRLSGRTGAHYASCGAVQRRLSLRPGEETEVIVLLGCASSRSAAADLARRYRDAARCDEAWLEMTRFWERTLGQIAVDTPSVETNLLLNGWLLYQTLACRMWARSAFYQAGGAYGFRDQLQDALAMLHAAPELARKQILIHAAHQYEEGDVQHWWHEETERGIRTLFSDDLLWLPYAAARYAEHTGDDALFAEEAPYLTSEPLKEGEHERYEATVRSGRSGSVYEHCVRAIDKALERIGEHGLPLIGVGDWNDGMNLVGAEGHGESVWLAWFLCEVMRRFEPICSERGDAARAARYRQMRERLAEAVQEHAWDGEWYRRAYTDAGTWLGSIHNEECRIDAIAQSWSVISGAAPKERALRAMQSFDRELVDRELSIAKLLTPAFDRSDPSPGYIQGYPPGIRENGAQYTHGVIWSIVAWCKLGQGDKAFELFHRLNPITHTRTDQEVRQYVGEPYVMAADVYSSEPHRGHAGWTWYTGAAGWMYQSGIEWLLGLQKRGNRLYLAPCVPSDWPGFEAVYRYGNTTYRLTFSRIPEATDGAKLLQAGPDTFIELRDDGGEHRIAIAL